MIISKTLFSFYNLSNSFSRLDPSKLLFKLRSLPNTKVTCSPLLTDHHRFLEIVPFLLAWFDWANLPLSAFSCQTLIRVSTHSWVFVFVFLYFLYSFFFCWFQSLVNNPFKLSLRSNLSLLRFSCINLI